MAMLEVKDLEVYYGMIQAIKGFSFEVNQGEVVALIGANGAGKTTTLHTITGLLPSKKGTVTFEGQDITKVPAHKIVYMGVAHVPEGRRVFADLSVYQIPESQMGATTALTSCGIAYVLKYIQAAMQAGIEMGVCPKDAQKMVAQSVKGAAELILNNDTHPSVEIDKVTTPGGITIKGINELDHAGFTSAVIKAIKAGNVE